MENYEIILLYIIYVLSVLFLYTDSDCPFGIFKLFLKKEPYLNIDNLNFQ
jgi:hypothetical protein